MDDLIQRAARRRAALLRELDEIETFMRVASRLSSDDSNTLARARANASLDDSRSVAARTVSLAYEKILAAGRPVPLRPLYDWLKSEVEIGGKDPLSTLSARLSNSDRLRSHRGMGWWVADRPLPSLFSGGGEREAAGAPQSMPAAEADDPSTKEEDEHAAALDEIDLVNRHPSRIRGSGAFSTERQAWYAQSPD